MNRTRFSFSECTIAPDLPQHILKKYAVSEDMRSRAVLGLGITDLCNLRCPFCYYRQDSSSQKHSVMTAVFLKHLLDGVGRVGTIMVGLEGEPLCHPDFPTMMSLCAKHADNIVLITNGLLLNADSVRVLNDCKVSSIILSCDATTSETYRKMRRGGNFDDFTKNARLLVASSNALISIHSVVTKDNWRELIRMPEFLNDLGITHMSLTQLRNNEWSELNGIYRSSYEEIQEFTMSVCREAEKRGVTIVFDYLYADRKMWHWLREVLASFSCVKSEFSESCISPWMSVSLLSDGRIFPCCGDIEPVFPENINFEGIFNNKVLLKLRYVLSGQNFPEVCRKCLRGEYI